MIRAGGKAQPLARGRPVEPDMEEVPARRAVRLNWKRDPVKDPLAGLPEVGGVVARVRCGVLLAINPAVRSNKLNKAGQSFGFCPGLPRQSNL